MDVTGLGLLHVQNVLNAASLVSVISTDPDGVITVFNPGAERMLGYAADEVVGKETPAFIHLEAEVIARSLELSTEFGRPIEGFEVFIAKALIDGYEEREWTYVKKNGTHIQVNLGVTAIKDDTGKIVGFLGIGTDITERKNAEKKLAESEERHHFFLDNVEEGVLLAEDNKIVDISNVWLIMFRCERSEVIGKSSLNFVAPQDYERVRSLIQRGHSEPYEALLLRKDGSTFPALIRGRLVKFGGRTARLATVLDITRQKEAEKSLLAAKAEAEQANKAKSEFLSSMSHELRTPMNAILGFSQMLELNPEEPLSETQKSCITEIRKGGEHLLKLINEVLDLTKIEAGKMDLVVGDVCLGTIVNECLALTTDMARKRHIEIIVDETIGRAPIIKADPTRLKQSLLNLISSGIKYNHEYGKITIGGEAVKTARYRISVCDTGPGIPQDKAGGLFAPFNRLKSNLDVEGTGIGLTITKKLIEMMDGQVGVDTEVGKGSTFYVELSISPVGRNRDQAKATHRSNNVPIKGAPLPSFAGTVLYIEDNPANLQLMELIVKRIEHLSLVSAHDAELGIELAKVITPDLIILDINLPGMDGFVALKKLRNTPATKNIPVIALSANAMPKDIERGLNAGFQKYLTKPIVVTDAIDAIRSTMTA